MRVVDLVARHDKFRFIVVVSARIQVAVPTREIGAGNLQPEAVTGAKIVAGNMQIQTDGVDLAGLHVQGFVKTLAVTHTQGAFLDIESAAIRVDIDQFGGEVCIFSRR